MDQMEKQDFNCPECNSNDLFFNNSNYLRCNKCNYSWFTNTTKKRTTSLVDKDILFYRLKRNKKVIITAFLLISVPLMINIIGTTVIKDFLINVVALVGSLAFFALIIFLIFWWWRARNTCPNCDSKFTKQLIEKEYLGADRVYTTNTGLKVNNRYKNYYQCQSCRHQWWEEHVDFWAV